MIDKFKPGDKVVFIESPYPPEMEINNKEKIFTIDNIFVFLDMCCCDFLDDNEGINDMIMPIDWLKKVGE